MADISFDPSSVIRAATDPPAAGSSAAPSKADSAPTFGDHLSRARRSSPPPSPADRGAADQTQPVKTRDPKPDGATPKASQDDQQKQPQKAAPDKRDEKAPDSQPTDSAANAAAAANPAAATPPPAPEKDAIKAAETASTTDAALKAAAASQAEANKSATSPAAASAEQAAAAQATAAAAATTAIPQPASAPTKEPHPAADQAPGAAKTTPINPQLAALIESTAAKAAAENSAPATSTAAPRPQTPADAAQSSGAATSATTKAVLASQALPSAARAQRDASAPSQNSQDGSNATAGAANAAVVAATQIVVDAASVKPAGRAADKTLSDSTGQAGSRLPQDPTAPTPSTSTSQPPSGAASQLPGNSNNFAAELQAKSAADGSLGATADADRLRFVQRVARAFQAAGDNGGQVKLRLSPPELGSLQLNITMKDGTMTAHIQAETSSAQNLLLNNLPDLRDRLAQQDIRIDRFDVELMDRSPGGMPQTPDRNSNADDFNRRPAPARNAAAGVAIEAAGPAAASVYQGGSGLNVVI